MTADTPAFNDERAAMPIACLGDDLCWTVLLAQNEPVGPPPSRLDLTEELRLELYQRLCGSLVELAFRLTADGQTEPGVALSAEGVVEPHLLKIMTYDFNLDPEQAPRVAADLLKAFVPCEAVANNFTQPNDWGWKTTRTEDGALLVHPYRDQPNDALTAPLNW